MTFSRGGRQSALMALALAIAVLAVYWPAHQFEFIDYDDDKYVFNNPEVMRGLSGWGLVWAFVDFHVVNYHPITWLSHMLDVELFGLNPGGHHVTSVVLHAATAVLLLFALKSLTGSTWRSAFVASLFALHPLRVESVAWISERKDVLSGLFFVLTIWAYGHYVKAIRLETPEAAVRFWRSRSYRIAVSCFLLGMLSKPMLMTVPAVLLLLDFWPLNRLPEIQGKWTWRHMKPVVADKLPFLGIAFAFALLTVLAQQGGAIKSTNAASRLGNVFSAYWGYVEKTFWPAELCVLYLRPETFSIVAVALGVTVLVAGTGLAWALRRRAPYLITGWLWFVVMLVPVSGVVTLGDLCMADRYSYLPSIGLAVAVTWGSCALLARVLPDGIQKPTWAVLALVVLIGCIRSTHEQLLHWRNTESVMKQALHVNPSNFVAHINLGVYHARKGDLEAARSHRQRAKELLEQAGESQRRSPPVSATTE